MWHKETQFTALVNALSPDLYRYAFWLCRHREHAEDLVQETFARAWRAIEDLKDDRAARAWLLVTLRREHARYFERERHPPLISIRIPCLPRAKISTAAPTLGCCDESSRDCRSSTASPWSCK